MMNQFLRASEFIDRLTLQNSGIFQSSIKVTKKAEQITASTLNQSKTADFEDNKSA
jgi:hypothetical protein